MTTDDKTRTAALPEAKPKPASRALRIGLPAMAAAATEQPPRPLRNLRQGARIRLAGDGKASCV